MKRRIRLTENDLRRIVNNSVKQLLREEDTRIFQNNSGNANFGGDGQPSNGWIYQINGQGDERTMFFYNVNNDVATPSFSLSDIEQILSLHSNDQYIG